MKTQQTREDDLEMFRNWIIRLNKDIKKPDVVREYIKKQSKPKFMKPGDIKKVSKKGLNFFLQATDEEFLTFDEKTKQFRLRQVGIVITDLPENEFGIKKGSKMLISK